VVSCQVVNEIVNKREGILIQYCPLVQVAVILYWAEFPVFLLDEEEAAGIGGVGALNPLQL
jgi:hypothetical protein